MMDSSQSKCSSQHFLQLPRDLIEEILRRLDYASLFHCSLACRLLYNIVETSCEFQYALELGRQALVDTSPASGNPYSTRLENIRRQRDAWHSLTWRKQFEVTIHIKLEAYEMVDGFFSCIDSAGNFQVVHLPSGDDLFPPKVSKAHLHIIPQDFTIDPAQDLAVFTVPADGPFSRTEGRDMKIHLRTLSSNEPHPVAEIPLLSFCIYPDVSGNEVQMSSLQVVDEILAIFYSTSIGWISPRLLIWNWKTGVLLTDSHLYPLPRNSMGFSLIAPYAFVVARIEDSGSIEIFTISRTTLAQPTHIIRLSLPLKNAKASLQEISIHSGPLGSSVHPHPCLESVIHVISLQYIAGPGVSRYWFYIFVLGRTLLSFISRYQFEAMTGSSLRWDEWSEGSTRVIPDLTPNSWLRYVHGQRIVSPPFGGGLSTQTLRILDFNVQRSRDNPIILLASTQAYTGPNGNGTTTRTLRSNATIVSDDDIFEHRIVSTLPCFSIDTQIHSPAKFESFMIDQSHIVGMRLRKDEREVQLHIFCF